MVPAHSEGARLATASSALGSPPAIAVEHDLSIGDRVPASSARISPESDDPVSQGAAT